MIEDNTPTVTARRRKPSKLLRIRLETARRLQALNRKTKARRAAAKAKRDKENSAMSLGEEGSYNYEIAPRIPKIKKNKLSRPHVPDSKFRKRQRGKTWLPTHMYHAKRAHMTPSQEPLWRFAIPLTPTEKCYRPTHRAAGTRGAVAWDMSYISTIQIEGTASALENVLRALSVDGEDAWGKKGEKWRRGTRTLQTWLHEREGDRRPIAPVTLIWCAKGTSENVEASGAGRKKARDKIMIRVHPSAFLQLWNEILEVSKRQNPPVMVEDLRFEIGSIEITGPGSAEALIATMRPFTQAETEFPKDSPEHTWSSLLGVTDSSSLPPNALLAFNISDPRLHFPFQSLKPSISESTMGEQAALLSSWPPDRTQGSPALFDRRARLAAIRCLPSQKAINRRRAQAGPGGRPAAKPGDPEIPVIILATRPRGNPGSSCSRGTWTVLLPWKYVLPLWYMLMHYPLSTGGNPRFGGLLEQRQLAFERGEPWFPGDYPGTRAGWEWSLREAEEKRKEWERRPKGKRIEYDSLDLGNGQRGEIGVGWACDWERLVRGRGDADAFSKTLPESEDVEMGESSDAKTTCPPLEIQQVRSEAAHAAFRRAGSDLPAHLLERPHLATVRITLHGRGTPRPCARIYRLPTGNVELRKQWLSLLLPKQPADTPARPPDRPSQKEPPTIPNVHDPQLVGRIAATLVSPPGSEEEKTSHLALPPEEDLIGFVTSGNYNLSEGRGTGIGSILLSKILDPATDGQQDTKGAGQLERPSPNIARRRDRERRTCIVRSAGERVGRLGFWEFV